MRALQTPYLGLEEGDQLKLLAPPYSSDACCGAKPSLVELHEQPVTGHPLSFQLPGGDDWFIGSAYVGWITTTGLLQAAGIWNPDEAQFSTNLKEPRSFHLG